MERRSFLTAAVTGTVAWRGALGAPSERVVVGIMGAGGRGAGLAQGYAKLPGVEVGYVCDTDKNRAGAAAASVEKAVGKAPIITGDFRHILNDKTIDALVCAAPNHWHAPATILACSAGKHVYVEKPCSHNPREGELLVEASEKNNRLVQMGNQRRTWPKIREAIEAIHKGEIGKVHLAQSYYTNNRPTIGKGEAKPVPPGLDFELWQGPAPRKPFQDNYLHYNWHWFWHWGNGELGNNGIHMIDLCRWGLAVDFPIRARSSGGRYHFQDDQETPDTQQVEFTFPGGKFIQWLGLSCMRFQQDRQPDVVFIGEKGTLEIRGLGYTIYDAKGKEVRKAVGAGGDADHLANFVGAIRGRNTLNSPGPEAHKSTLLCHLGNISQRVGEEITCDGKTGMVQGKGKEMWKREYAPGWEPKV
ncbi:MAG: Gfo/Idh/MocA family oxidoreductase [Gemmataceae bacterium]|nr:Gfo/Idh/MocA family oxidoreductase [Gemmataceae bacterium]